MARDEFSNRLAGQPDQAHLEHYRIPNFETKVEHYWEPLLALNRAQAIVLAEVGILDRDEAIAIRDALDDLDRPGDRETFAAFEGPYLYIEHAIIERVGEDVGGALHTGRSRNDLYAAAVRIAVRDRLLEVAAASLAAREALIERAAESTDIVLPAFTHSQPAQPITLAHYLLAADHALARDVTRLQRAFERTNRSPLGAAAIGGTGFPLDRERLAALTGFDAPVENTYDAIATVDYLPETATAIAMAMTTISRVSADLLVWSMPEVGFVELPDALASVSSIMPQKKNPGVLERTRTAASGSIGAMTATFTALEAVPFGDVGETTDAAVPVLAGADDVVRTARLFAAIVGDMHVHPDRMERDAAESFSTMTELADTLVREAGLSFRQAHEVVGRLVRDVTADDRTAEQITPGDLDAAARSVLGRTIQLDDEQLEAAIEPERNVARRDILGGTAPTRNEEDLDRQRRRLEDQRDWLERTSERLDAARTDRREWTG